MSIGPSLSTTTYGVLGLLAVRPYSTYELAKAMGLSVGRVWPRTQSKLFEEPKKLVQHGYATAREERVGRRPRTVYTITSSGRQALASWLAEPGDGPVVEFEGLVKLIFAEHGTRADALATIARARAWAVQMNADSITAGEKFAERGGRFEERRATTLLMGAFLTDFYALVAQWADWASAEVSSWPDDIASHRVGPELTRAVLARARWSEQS
ncbi:DNA-binding PadR family transcriptional regulator [Kribbella sp. VKM Ac-2527]|uniref:DNA-binding PadR family transcriptional regulator n=1 Tax=Kribbella caucasensis TaxID=2512215 RepID=A0A4R6KRF7_9ACTN|nr:PadR family transcriptional regulator [Kribbella sp. VKM Ac-2527]TDO55029.1 DNA-binding PadR family transcriptional regulator [Kribbella sp. VKM Ac-2527]